VIVNMLIVKNSLMIDKTHNNVSLFIDKVQEYQKLKFINTLILFLCWRQWN